VHRRRGRAVGRAVYTGLLNERGTYEGDITVTRTGPTGYLVVSSAASTIRDLDWLHRRAPAGSRVAVTDVTDGYAVFAVMGPRSRELLAAMSGRDLSDEAFPFGTSQLLGVDTDAGPATVRATRITYVGELGWELYVPAADGARVYAALCRRASTLGGRPGGYYAIESMRLEQGYRAFGRELTGDVDPVEAGLLFACKLSGDFPFLGRAAVEATRARGPRRRVVSFVLSDAAAYGWGGELVLRDGIPVGQVTSAAWGATVGGCVGLALVADRDAGVTTPDWVRSGDYVLDVGGVRFPAAVSLRAPRPSAALATPDGPS
jgi:4-methylaminobutanoate oxidase (formaldehyde-forming)